MAGSLQASSPSTTLPTDARSADQRLAAGMFRVYTRTPGGGVDGMLAVLAALPRLRAQIDGTASTP